EGRYYLFNAIANQLRFPNSHTHFFSCLALWLFHTSPKQVLREQLTRVLLERLVVQRPHPWGLLITFIELIKNQRYDFWSHDFVTSSPRLNSLLKTVAKSCKRQPA
ncbi:MAG: CCR4-NOT transcription complex subunit 1, partial [Cercozoa sp. M6MM]